MIGTMIDKNCPFCKILKGELPSSRIYEDENTLAFLDIWPQSDGHTLVILKKHYEYIYDVPDEEVADLYKVVKKVARAVKKSINAGGVSITQHNESAAGQDVFHVHVHVIPRYEGQRLRRIEEIQEATRAKLDEIAKMMRQFI
ncbi:HIT family protein [Candidatus Bathyarchaeota archaeon]|jgi:histidine triad (HIT) family protein|nr:HIT family protein [Candidatus Bathyarchaeota archaeon]